MAQANQTYESLSAEHRQELLEERRQQIMDVMTNRKGEVLQEGFLASWGILDIVFVALAISTAYRVGASARADPIAAYAPAAGVPDDARRLRPVEAR